jgi:uncharacterized membrane protein
MTLQIDWIELILYFLSLAVMFGIYKQRLHDHSEKLIALRAEVDTLKTNHNDVKLTIVNTPTKDDMVKLGNELHKLQLTITRLGMIIGQLAEKNGIHVNFPNGD